MGISLRISHLSSAILVLNVLIDVLVSSSLCETMNGAQGGHLKTSSNADSDRIVFPESKNDRTTDQSNNTNNSDLSSPATNPQIIETQITSDTGRNQSAYPDVISRMTTFHQQSNHTNNSYNDHQQRFDSNITMFVPNGCLDKGEEPYCLEPLNYPSSLIEELLLRKSGGFYLNEIKPVYRRMQLKVFLKGEIELCQSRKEMIYPKVGERKDAEKWFIVNTDYYKQGVMITHCLHPSEPCYFNRFLPNFYTSKCEQNYMYILLLAVTPDGNFVNEKFKFPTFCECGIHNSMSEP